MRAQINEESIITANAQFWDQMLNMHLHPVPLTEDFCVGAGHLLASVEFSGTWKGRIEVRLAPGLANAATAAMMMQSVDAVTEADTLDAAREIANMIAGVIKSSLPRHSVMALPESVVASEQLCIRPCPEDTLVVAFRHDSGGLLVLVFEEECGQ